MSSQPQKDCPVTITNIQQVWSVRLKCYVHIVSWTAPSVRRGEGMRHAERFFHLPGWDHVFNTMNGWVPYNSFQAGKVSRRYWAPRSRGLVAYIPCASVHGEKCGHQRRSKILRAGFRTARHDELFVPWRADRCRKHFVPFVEPRTGSSIMVVGEAYSVTLSEGGCYHFRPFVRIHKKPGYKTWAYLEAEWDVDPTFCSPSNPDAQKWLAMVPESGDGFLDRRPYRDEDSVRWRASNSSGQSITFKMPFGTKPTIGRWRLVWWSDRAATEADMGMPDPDRVGSADPPNDVLKGITIETEDGRRLHGHAERSEGLQPSMEHMTVDACACIAPAPNPVVLEIPS